MMEDLIILKEENFNKVLNSEKGRKIFEKLNKLENAFKKLSLKEQTIFSTEFEGKFKESADKINSVYSKKVKENPENLYGIIDIFLLLTVLFLGS